HAYSGEPQNRLVGINELMLREGGYVAPGLRLEQITPDGMIFSYRGYRFSRGVQSSGSKVETR
ncbi:MAG: general secretion pathway protein GspB, partial [Sulfuricaulis sp.]|nr:general secretion pathway protein GspB [Sulfuricaulis sp.]